MADEDGEAAAVAAVTSETEGATGNEETTEELTAVGAEESDAEAAEMVCLSENVGRHPCKGSL